jgi:hypothetical protein
MKKLKWHYRSDVDWGKYCCAMSDDLKGFYLILKKEYNDKYKKINKKPYSYLLQFYCINDPQRYTIANFKYFNSAKKCAELVEYG